MAVATYAEYTIMCDALDQRVHRYEIHRNDKLVSYADALELWQYENAFVACFVSALADSPFTAFRWETPPITKSSIDRPFEFVLLDSPGLERTVDNQTYAEYFARDNTGEGVVTFENLGKDALLIIPTPLSPSANYGHVAGFVRSAPEAQTVAFWSAVGAVAQGRLSEQPMWISTHGGGVSWFHIRLDSAPKYYGYGAYREDV